MDSQLNQTVDTESTSALNRAAFEAVLPAALALDEASLAHITTDPVVAATSVRPKLEAIAAMRSEVEKFLPHHDMAAYDALEQRGRALRYAEALYQTAVAPAPATGPVVEKLQEEFEILMTECKLLTQRGIIPPLNDNAVRLTTGHRQLAANTINVVVHIRTHWTSVEGKTTMTPKSLEGIEAQAERLDDLVSFRDSQPARIAEASRVRTRIYTLFMRSLKEVTRAAQYLHEDELDQYVPDAFPNRGAKRAAPKGAGDKLAAEPPGSAEGGPAQARPAPAMNGEVGSPNSSPFVRAS